MNSHSFCGICEIFGLMDKVFQCMSAPQEEIQDVRKEVLQAVEDVKNEPKFVNLSYEKQYYFNKKILDSLSTVTLEVGIGSRL